MSIIIYFIIMLYYDYDVLLFIVTIINILKIIIILKTSVWLSPLEIFIIILITLKGIVTDFYSYLVFQEFGGLLTHSSVWCNVRPGLDGLPVPCLCSK